MPPMWAWADSLVQRADPPFERYPWPPVNRDVSSERFWGRGAVLPLLHSKESAVAILVTRISRGP